MTFTISLIMLATALFGVTIGVLATIVIGIRSDDRAKNLTSSPRTHVQAASRLVVGVGVRRLERLEQSWSCTSRAYISSNSRCIGNSTLNGEPDA
jgi:hypothetical protein